MRVMQRIGMQLGIVLVVGVLVSPRQVATFKPGAPNAVAWNVQFHSYIFLPKCIFTWEIPFRWNISAWKGVQGNCRAIPRKGTSTVFSGTQNRADFASSSRCVSGEVNANRISTKRGHYTIAYMGMRSGKYYLFWMSNICGLHWGISNSANRNKDSNHYLINKNNL